MLRLGIASPFPPSTSGIADYAAELVPALERAGLEAVVFFEGDVPPTASAAGREAWPIDQLPRQAPKLDALLFQLGNSAPHHAASYRALLETPGIVALHEYMLHHLVRAMTLGRGAAEQYVGEMEYCAGETGRRAALRLMESQIPIDIWRYPLFERVVDHSRGVLVHSQFARRRILRSRPTAAVRVVPFPVDVANLPAPSDDERRLAKRRLGLEPEAPLVAAFGFVTPHKRLEPALAAFARLRPELPDARFAICGEVSPGYDLRASLARHGSTSVAVTGRLEREEFDRWMTATDVAINFRHPTGGETSASLLHLLARGVPTLVTDAGAFAELPDGVVAKVAIDELETEVTFEILRRLLLDPELRRQISSAARDHVAETHDLERSVQAQVEAIVEMNRLEPVASRAPRVAPRDGARAELLRALAAAAADLGVDDRAGGELEELAIRCGELGLGA